MLLSIGIILPRPGIPKPRDRSNQLTKTAKKASLPSSCHLPHNQCAWLWKFSYKEASLDTKRDLCTSWYIHLQTLILFIVMVELCHITPPKNVEVVSTVTQDVTFFGNRVTADVIS